jgi:prepilin-type N-terminal cleavage/methylation domain-containing protein
MWREALRTGGMVSITGPMIFISRLTANRPAGQAGFSLTEMLLVVATMAVVASIALPNLVSTQQSYQIHTAGLTVTSRVGEARMEALRRNRRMDVVLDPAAGTLRIVEVQPGPVDVLVSGPEYLPSTVIFDAAGTPNMRFAFDSLGRPINPPQTITLRHTGSQQRRVITVQSTGRLQVTQ